ncbi:MAG: tRNA threonylcarbamoyladenosine dehydratase [Oscillospiraceae bacterium]|jgi:tRNA A37 threonylcarbamoyladenosine dehydratase
MSQSFLREEMLLGHAAIEQLQNSHVAIFGLGGVGSWCAEALARAGVGKLTLIDQDTAGESNINRQLCALSSTLGQPKAEILAARLLDIHPALQVRPMVARYEASTREVFFDTAYDYIVDAIDLVACKVDLICTARERGIPIISALGTGNKLDASQLQICDISKTEGCPLARVVRRELRQLGISHHTVVFSKELALKPTQVEAPPPGRRSVPGSVVWVPATAGLLLAQHVVLSIAGTVSS